ncbi:MAG: cytochrome c [Anaerolineae bacterium]|nr:cytochrome c [Anaerolineae bacterium]
MVKQRQQSKQSRSHYTPVIIIAILLIGGGLTLLFFSPGFGQAQPITINGQSITDDQLALGETVYETNCAACHGIEGEGQPNWKIPDQNGVLPAPPHDSTGHTWHHADEQLLGIIANGGSMPDSAMPGYQHILSDEEMVAVLGYIKTFWGMQEYDFQQQVTHNSN